MYISGIDNGEYKSNGKEMVEIFIQKPVRALKIIYETNTEKRIVLLDKRIIEKTNDFFNSYNLNTVDKALIQILLQNASIHKRIEAVYKTASEELEMAIRTIKLKLVKIKNMLGYNYMHPDDFLRRIIIDIGIVENNINVFSA